MQNFSIYKGDTQSFTLDITVNGEPFVPQDGEKIVFSVGRFGKKLFSIEAQDGVVSLTHSQTDSLCVGEYTYDVRVYNSDYRFVGTPMEGTITVMGVTNDDLQL